MEFNTRLVLFLALLRLSAAVTDPDDVQSLTNLYGNLGRPTSLTGWTFDNPDPCSPSQAWKGIQCVGSAVTGIHLSGLGLSGWVSDFNKLSSLTSLDLSNNQLSGNTLNLPSNLQILNIGHNTFQGGTLNGISPLLSLVYLYADNNFISGNIPDIFTNLQNLSVINLSFNNISGQLPQTFSNLYNLSSLYLQYNQLTGPVNVLENLQLLDLNIEHNQFSGWIPASFSSIKNLKYDGNSFSTSPAPPPPPYTPPPPSPPKKKSISSPSPNTSGGGNPSGGTIAGIVVACILGVIVVFLVAAFFLWKPRRRRNINDEEKHQSATVLGLLPQRTTDAQTANESMTSLLPTETVLKLPPSEIQKESIIEKVSRKTSFRKGRNHISATAYSVADLQFATNSFGEDCLIGEGASGPVYRAEFSNGKILAVKKIDNMSSVQKDEDFLEIVSSISRLHNSNIAELIGYCVEHGQHLLVYEYFRRGSLHDMLHSGEDGGLTWNARVKIALGTARALEYLHEACQPAAIHKSVKSSNILLDEELNPHLSDSGMHALISGSESEVDSSTGYHAPEFTMSGVYTWQSDVYSYGVVMLELLTGRKPLDSSRLRGEQLLVRWAIPQLHDIDALANMVDSSLEGAYPVKSLSRFADIIALCVQPEMEFRPPMSEVVQSLVRLMQRST